MSQLVTKSEGQEIEDRNLTGRSLNALKIRGWGVLAGVLALFFLAYIYPYIPGLPNQGFCAVRNFLGVPCPGCGLTRSFIFLVHGGVRESIDAHPLGVVIAIWLAYFAGRSSWAVIAGRWPSELLTQQGRDICLGGFLLALFLQWLIHLYLILA